MPTVAIFPSKVRLDSCEGRLAFESRSPVFAGSFGESSFNVALGREDFCGSSFARSYMCARHTTAQCRKNLRRRRSRKLSRTPWTQGPSSAPPEGISGPKGEPFTGGFDHLTLNTDHSPQPAGTGSSYQSNYRRSKTYWFGQLQTVGL
jgi:hypothetical protein